MHTEDWNELCNCAICGAVISPAIDRTYSITPEIVVCWDCALQRGGSYDVEKDRWLVAPNVPELAAEETARASSP